MESISHSESETKQIAQTFASELKAGDIIVLYGDMGAGKSTFTKGLAQGLGIEKDITSPTFPLMNVYDVNTPNSNIKIFIHIDTYRLKDADELKAIGVEEYLGAANTLTVIEWPEKIEGLLQEKNVKKIILEHVNQGERKITIE